MENELTQFAKVFQDEDALRKSIATLFRHRQDVTGVQITHGPLERGKDIVFYACDPVGERKLYACVVKLGRITGAADSDQGAMNVLTQVTQALENPYLNPSGQNDYVAHVYVMTPHEISQSAMFSIEGALRSRSGQVTFCCGGKLLDLFRQYWPDFILESGDTAVYLSQMQSQIEKDDPVTVLLSEHSVFGSPAQFQKTYVKQRFLCPLVEYSYTFVAPIMGDLARVSSAEIRDLRVRLRIASSLVSLPHSWYGTPVTEEVSCALSTALQALAGSLLGKWEEAYDLYVRENKGLSRQTKTDVRLQIPLSAVERPPIQEGLEQVGRAAKELQRKVDDANRFVRQVQEIDGSLIRSTGYLTYCAVREIANRLPSILQPKGNERTLQLHADLLDTVEGSMLITGSAGHGKTSFCRHYAIADGKALINKKASVLPVYIKLHHLASRQLGTFEEEFFSTTELRASIGNRNDAAKARISQIRLYLDGLDEVPRVERQRELLELARTAVDSDPRIQVIVTARNYINGPWLNWLPRVAIAELNESQIADLVNGLLAGDTQDAQHFFRELKKVPSLQPLMKIPLLGTLIVSVYRKRTTLPENRIRLYETFLNLMCGGWDLAKNVRRRTDFGSVGKLSVLTRLAGHMQLNRERECNEQSIRVAVESSNQVWVRQLPELTEELLQDGVLTRSGVAYAFCHLSFQEYLAARELNDPSGRRQQNVLRWYMRGDDWWYQMLSFYIGTVGKPEDTEHWLRTSVREAGASGSIANDASERYRRLLECIVECAPGYAPKATDPFVDEEPEQAQPPPRKTKRPED